MKHIGLSGALGLAIFLVPVLGGSVFAQQVPTQEITYAVNNTTGFTGWNQTCCYAGSERCGGGDANLNWTDTIGYTFVRVEVRLEWGTQCANGAALTYQLNGVPLTPDSQPGGLLAEPAYNCNCLQQSSQQTGRNFTLAPDNTDYVPGGANTLTVNFNQNGGCNCFANNSSGWCIQVTIVGLNRPPDVPGNAVQIGPDAKTIPVGGICKGTTVRLRATMADPDNDACYMETEFQPITYFFQGLPNFGGNTAPAGQDAFIDVTNLIEGSYHWQVRAVDPFAFTSPWAPFGGNSEITADVVVDTSLKPPSPIDGKNHGGGDCDVSVGGSVGLLSPALLGLALLGLAFVRRKR